MRLAAALMAMVWPVYSSGDECFDVQYSANTVATLAGNEIAEIAILDEMHFEFDITINSFPTTGWANVFHCGTADLDRFPAIALHPDSDDADATYKGFLISFSTVTSDNPHFNPGPELVTGQSYHFELDVTQSSLVVTIDDVVRHENLAYEAHNTYDRQPCYSGDPWLPAADVVLTNLVISSPSECSPDCTSLDVDRFLDTCSSNYEGLVDGVSANSQGVTTNGAAITALDLRIDRLVIVDGGDVTPGFFLDFDNKDLLIIGLLVINVAVIVLSTYICVSGKASVKYQPVKAYGSE